MQWIPEYPRRATSRCRCRCRWHSKHTSKKKGKSPNLTFKWGLHWDGFNLDQPDGRHWMKHKPEQHSRLPGGLHHAPPWSRVGSQPFDELMMYLRMM